MTRPGEYVYAAVSEGGSGRYAYSNFLGIFFSIDEVRRALQRCHAGPVPGERYRITRRELECTNSQYFTVWKGDWQALDKALWR